MKKYSFIFFPDFKTSATIESVREKFSGEKLVDGLPPHLTFKRRFTLGKVQALEDILGVLDEFPLERAEVRYIGFEQFGDFTVMKVENPALNKWHLDLLTTLGGDIVTDGFEWEGERYNPHITLVKGKVADLPHLDFPRVILEKICLYEYEFSGDVRIGIKLVKCRTL